MCVLAPAQSIATSLFSVVTSFVSSVLFIAEMAFSVISLVTHMHRSWAHPHEVGCYQEDDFHCF